MNLLDMLKPKTSVRGLGGGAANPDEIERLVRSQPSVLSQLDPISRPAAPLPALAPMAGPSINPMAPQAGGGLLDSIQPEAGKAKDPRKGDKLMLLGAMLQDVGSSLGGGQGGRVLATKKYLEDDALNDQQKVLRSQIGGAFGSALGGGPGPQPSSAPIKAVGDFGGSAPAPTAPKPRQNIAQVFSLIAKGMASGLDMSPYLTLVEKMEPLVSREAYLSSLPESERATAAMDPTGYVKWARETALPKIESVGRGTDVVSIDQRTGAKSIIHQNNTPADPPFGWTRGPEGQPQFLPGGPADPAYLRQTSESRAEGQRAGAPPQFIMYGPSRGRGGSDDISPSDVMGPILNTVASKGPDALSPGQKLLWERYRDGTSNSDPMAAVLTALGLGGGAPRPGAPAGGAYSMPTPPTAPGARPAPAAAKPAAPAPRGYTRGPAPEAKPKAPAPPRAGPGSSQAAPAQPASRAEAARLPAGTWIRDPSGNVFQKAR